MRALAEACGLITTVLAFLGAGCCVAELTGATRRTAFGTGVFLATMTFGVLTLVLVYASALVS